MTTPFAAPARPAAWKQAERAAREHRPASPSRGSVPFRGPDRRADRLEEQLCDWLTLPRARWAAVLVVVLGGAGAIGPLTALGAGWPIAALSALVGLATTAVLLSEWAVSRRTRPAYTALALAPAWAMAELASLPLDGAAHQAWVSFHGLVPAAAAVALLVHLQKQPEIDASNRPLRTLGGLLALLTALVLVDVSVSWSGLEEGPRVLLAGAAAAALWCLTATLCHGPAADRYGTSVALFAFAVGTLDRAIGSSGMIAGSASSALATGRLVTLLGWALLLALAVGNLRSALGVAARRQLTLRLCRDDLDRSFRNYQRQIDERHHDVRSLVAGIQGATSTLLRYRAHLNSSEQQLLESALMDEVARLGRSLDPSDVTMRSFALRDTVGPLVVAERTRGTAVTDELPDVDVTADADATALVLQNLLSNARRHAPGAHVTITAEVCEDVVRVIVADDGPGLAVPLREQITALFAGAPVVGTETSAEGVTGRRHGLGLAICARLACEQGARLSLLESVRGTRIALTLPLTRSTDARGAA